jgi:hypothetical protein
MFADATLAGGFAETAAAAPGKASRASHQPWVRWALFLLPLLAPLLRLHQDELSAIAEAAHLAFARVVAASKRSVASNAPRIPTVGRIGCAYELNWPASVPKALRLARCSERIPRHSSNCRCQLPLRTNALRPVRASSIVIRQ